MSVGGDILDPMEGGIANQLKNNKKLAVGNGSQKMVGWGILTCAHSHCSLHCDQGDDGGGSGLSLWAEMCWIPWRLG